MCYQCTKMHWSLMYTKYIREVSYVVLIFVGVIDMSTIKNFIISFTTGFLLTWFILYEMQIL